MPAYEMHEEEIEDVLGPEYLTVEKVSQLLRMTEREVERVIREGRLEAINYYEVRNRTGA